MVDKNLEVADSILANPNVQYYALGEATVLTLVEVPEGCRLVVRDSVGKTVWDVRLPREEGASSAAHKSLVRVRALEHQRKERRGSNKPVQDAT